MLAELKSVFGKLKPQYDDDSIDRLNYIYTVFIISVFALVVGAKQYVGIPIQCWVPAEFDRGKGWEKYAESYCFVENTYFLQPAEEFPDDPGVRTDKEINYYQWVPIILALQALMFYLPRLIWNMLNFAAGLHVPGLIEAVSEVTKDDKRQNRRALRCAEDQEKNQTLVAQHIVKALRITMPDECDGPESGDPDPPTYNNIHLVQRKPLIDHTSPPSYSRISGPPKKAVSTGYFTTLLYIFTKFLYCLNVVVQFFIMNNFFARDYMFWGFEILRDLLNNREWDVSGHFPRVTYCDFDIASLAQVRRYSVQCVLIINMFNEKIFLFLWWWFFVVSIINILNFMYWVVISFNPGSRKEFVENYLKAKRVNLQVVSAEDVKPKNDQSDYNVTKFVHFLRPDGILILRLISDNVGDIICSDVIAALWKAYWNITDEPKPEPEPEKEHDGLQETLPEDKKAL